MFFKKIKEKKILKKVKEKNDLMRRKEVKSIVVYYDIDNFFIGDTLKDVSKILLMRRYFPNAEIDFIASNNLVLDLMKNSPYPRRMLNKVYQEISLIDYELVYIISDNEESIMKDIIRKHWRFFKTKEMPYYLFSLTEAVFNDEKSVKFPTHFDVIHFEYEEADMRRVANTEVFLSKEELNWANNYLEEQGVEENEEVTVLLDSTSNDGKLIAEEQFFEMIRILIQSNNTKILVYDINKEEGEKKKKYEENLSEYEMSKIIFARNKSLRKDISVLGSNYVKLIIGPCTGIMHCASGVHTVLTNKKASIIVYKGYFDAMDETDDVYWWWGGNTVVDCLLLLKREEGEESIPYLLESLTETISYKDLDYTNRIKANQILEFTRVNSLC